jgi:hypothetical protein
MGICRYSIVSGKALGQSLVTLTMQLTPRDVSVSRFVASRRDPMNKCGMISVGSRLMILIFAGLSLGAVIWYRGLFSGAKLSSSTREGYAAARSENGAARMRRTSDYVSITHRKETQS